MNTKKAAILPREPTVEYIVVDDEFNILDEVFNALFEHVEKEIK